MGLSEARRTRSLDGSSPCCDFKLLDHNRSTESAGEIIAVVASSPAAQALRRRVEEGEVLLDAVNPGAQAFLAALERGRLHHAWLLVGPEGVGKATFAYRATRRLRQEIEQVATIELFNTLGGKIEALAPRT